MKENNRLNHSQKEIQQKLCGGLGCDTDSLVTQVYLASKTKSRSYVAATPASWIDDYLDWLRTPACCRYNYDTNQFCPAYNPGKICLIQNSC